MHGATIKVINMFDGVLYVMHLVGTDGDWQSGDKHSEAGRWFGSISKYIKVQEELKEKQDAGTHRT
jgi:hypothetical protein